jgi:uncharacterized protein YbjT (DUF2867 family)
VAGDVLKLPTLTGAMCGVDVAYYLVHSMGTSGDFVEQDRLGARQFAAAAREAGVRRIVYLGGLGEDDPALSPHLQSRHEVGTILRESGVPVIEFRASIVIGSGSLSFEMVRALMERLPVMVTPRWVRVLAQPIGIEDVIAYLMAVADMRTAVDPGVYEIGGPDVMSYRDMMREYARQRGLRRVMIPVPVLTPRLSSLWLGLVTPVYARVGRKLVDSIRHPTVVRDDRALRVFAVKPIGVREAMARALRREDFELARTRWSDAVSASVEPASWGGVRFGNRLVDARSRVARATIGAAFGPIQRVGGETGWYYANWLWRVRGALDVLVGGVGMRRGRRDPERLSVGDTVDCWRVEEIEVNRRLRLRAEMKLPGRAWLEFEVRAEGEGTRVMQTAMFDPVGLTGLAYWYAVWPLHKLIFRRMLERIVAAAESSEDRVRR